MIIRDIYRLAAPMIRGVALYRTRCAAEGIETIVLETLRELATQMAYRARGVAPVWLVKEYFKAAGLWAITDAEAATINTQTMASKHLLGLAIDMAPAKDGAAWWSAPLSVWEQMWKIAEDECGLDACAGGKWEAWQKNGRPWDLPHHEFRTEVTV